LIVTTRDQRALLPDIPARPNFDKRQKMNNNKAITHGLGGSVGTG
jgi:hypothetical protein